MAIDFKHLDLILQVNGKKKAPQKMSFPVPFDIKQHKENRKQHSDMLVDQGNFVQEMWTFTENKRKVEDLPKLPDDKPLLIQIPIELLDVDFLRRSFGFEIVCEYDDGIVIVATQPDKLREGIIKIKDFANGIRGTGSVAQINNIITEESNETRLQRILSDELLKDWRSIVETPNTTITVEMSIECQGTIVISEKPEQEKNEADERFRKRLNKWEEKRNNAFEQWDELCRLRESELERIIESYGGAITDIYGSAEADTVQDSLDIKITIPHKCLVDLALNYPYVFEIKPPDDISKPIAVSEQAELVDVPFSIMPPDKNSPVVCVIDSGIQEGHAFIKDAIRSDISNCFLPGRTDIDDQVQDGGHGTRVAGAVLYPNGISSIMTPQYQLPCFIVNARVLDEDNFMPQTLLSAKILNEIIKKYYNHYTIRLYNHSIASSYPCLKKYMSSWAAAIDTIAYEKDILFIQAAGNIQTDNNNPFNMGITQHLNAGRRYPDYLLEDSCRIPNPAQSMQALTVGSINIDAYEDDDWISLGGKGAISSYSKTGLGLWEAIKPEVVEYGGDELINKRQPQYRTIPALLPELVRVSPPAYARDAEGTSFAAPKVAHIAAQLQRLLPDKSALLYKALLVQSARWTPWAEDVLRTRQKAILRLMGYGLPDVERAVTNNVNRITYISSGRNEISAGYVDIYRVKVPESIRNQGNMLRIDITLTFCAKPRRTRKGFRGYFSTWVDWTTNRFEENLTDFETRTIEISQDLPMLRAEQNNMPIHGRGNIPWTIGNRGNWGTISDISRNRSATQKDWAIMEAYNLPAEFCIAVIGHKGWDNSGMYPAQYALCVSFESINRDIEIYEAFSEVETQIPIEQEVEIDTELTEEQ